MQAVKALFASDAVKQVLASIALVAGVLAVYMPAGQIKTVAATVAGILGSLGIISGGTAGTQPAAIQQALGAQPPVAVTTATIPLQPKGFVKLSVLGWIVVILGGATLLLAPGCATLSHASGSTGAVDLGKGYICSASAAPTDASSCTKALTQSCEAPLPKADDGSCKIAPVVFTTSYSPRTDWKCTSAAAPGTTPCTQALTNTCVVPVPKEADGSCP